MDIILNGDTITVDDNVNTIALLLTHLNMPTVGVAVAVGRKVVPRSKWGEHTLQSGDSLTLIRATQGG